MQYINGGRRIVLGLLDKPRSILARGPQEIDRPARGDYCRRGKAYWDERTDGFETDWRVTPLDFGEDRRLPSYRMARKDSVPPEPVLEEGLFVRTVARAHGIVDDTYIMVRIDLKNVIVEPPSEEELRAPWDPQVAKVRYLKALERSTELLTPQSRQTNK